MNDGVPSRETEILNAFQTLNEYIMISLRTIEGMNLETIESKWGSEQRNRIEKELQKFLNLNLLNKNNSFVQLTDEGMLRADGIASELFA